MLTVKDPDAWIVGGFLIWSQVTVTLLPTSKTARLKNRPSIVMARGGTAEVRVTFPVLLKI
jgi:hypothetical protein